MARSTRSKAKPTKSRATVSKVASPEAADDKKYVVERIIMARVSMKRRRKIWKFLVKWEGYGEKSNTWEPVESFRGSELVEQFWNSVQDDSGEKVRKSASAFRLGHEFVSSTS